MSIEKDSRNCVQVVLTTRFLSNSFFNMERSMIDAASGGALGDMTPVEARNLIEKMASNSQ